MKLKFKSYHEALENLPGITIAVVGDIILDQYLIGDVSRISPEAPVPVVHVKKESVTLGGSGNVVKNLNSIGVKSLVFARIGKDENAKLLIENLLKEGITKSECMLLESDRVPTTIKTRIIASHQQVCRVDRENVVPLNSEEVHSIKVRYEESLKDINGTILSDYDKGFLTPILIRELIQISRRNNKFTSVDPQVSHFFQYIEAGILTPNHIEAGRALGRNIYTDSEIEEGARELSERLNSDYLMITRGEKGMTLFDSASKSYNHIPTVAREVFDVTGAGDTVISIYTAFFLAGLPPLDACLVANAAAGLVVEKLGSSVVTLEELTERLYAMGLL